MRIQSHVGGVTVHSLGVKGMLDLPQTARLGGEPQLLGIEELSGLARVLRRDGH